MKQSIELDLREFWQRTMAVVAILSIYIIATAGGFLLVHRVISGPYCNCGLSLTLTVSAMASSGVIVGISLYYFLSGSFRAEKESLRETAQETTRFLPGDQRKIVEAIIEREGEISQSEMPEQTDLSKVKISRKLKDLERQGIISREENGMTKKVRLEEKFEELLL